jgi:hypothetical protein
MEDFGALPRLVRVSREQRGSGGHRRLHMSEDKEYRSGRSAADEGGEDETQAHVRLGRGAADEGGKDEVEAHVKTKRSDDGDDSDDVQAHVKQGKA